MGIYTKTGDKGTTALFGGQRVAKDGLKVECYGTVDETNSMMGLAYSLCTDKVSRERIHTIQERLFALGAELASDEKGLKKLKDKISDEDIAYLESIVDDCMALVGETHAFVVPGVDPCSGALHVARTVARRAERLITKLSKQDDVREQALKYINRLSDCLYALARREEALNQVKELTDKVVDRLVPVISGNLSLALARKMALLAEEKANQMGIPFVFAACDSGGNLVLLNRMEGALIASVDIAIKKAQTANCVKMPTHVLGELDKPGAALAGISNTNEGDLVVFGGGYPFVTGSVVVGGIGVSGGSVEEDMAVASYVLERIL